MSLVGISACAGIAIVHAQASHSRRDDKGGQREKRKKGSRLPTPTAATDRPGNFPGDGTSANNGLVVFLVEIMMMITQVGKGMGWKRPDRIVQRCCPFRITSAAAGSAIHRDGDACHRRRASLEKRERERVSVLWFSTHSVRKKKALPSQRGKKQPVEHTERDRLLHLSLYLRPLCPEEWSWLDGRSDWWLDWKRAGYNVEQQRS